MHRGLQQKKYLNNIFATQKGYLRFGYLRVKADDVEHCHIQTQRQPYHNFPATNEDEPEDASGSSSDTTCASGSGESQGEEIYDVADKGPQFSWEPVKAEKLNAPHPNSHPDEA